MLFQGEVVEQCGCIDAFLAVTEHMWNNQTTPFCHNLGIDNTVDTHKLHLDDNLLNVSIYYFYVVLL